MGDGRSWWTCCGRRRWRGWRGRGGLGGGLRGGGGREGGGRVSFVVGVEEGEGEGAAGVYDADIKRSLRLSALMTRFEDFRVWGLGKRNKNAQKSSLTFQAIILDICVF